MLVIVDYGVGNLASVRNMFKRVGVDALVSSDHDVIGAAQQLVLPGVGAFDVGMSNLSARGLDKLLTQRVIHDQVPILGICLGMQLLTCRSEEGKLQGLGWLRAETRRLPTSFSGESLRIPHMGWNTVDVLRAECPLLRGVQSDARYYFVHSYHVHCDDPAVALGQTTYGPQFVSMVWHRNIYGAQFHPEKSHRFGMAILKNFAEHCGGSHDTH